MTTAASTQPLCRLFPPDWWFCDESRPAEVRRAVEVCAACPSKASCLEEALRIDAHGIWGGTTRAQRMGLLRRKPEPVGPIHGEGMGSYREHLVHGEVPCLDCCMYVVRVERSKRRARGRRTGEAA